MTEEVTNALALAAKTFRRYEKLHADKRTIDADVKARDNYLLAEKMEAAMRSASNSPTTNGEVSAIPIPATEEVERAYPGDHTKAEWDVIAQASYDRASHLPED